MKIVFRVDSGPDSIGMGHLVRSSALGCELQQRGYEVLFVCKSYDDSSSGFLSASGLNYNLIPPSSTTPEELASCREASLIIIDSYNIDEEYLRRFAETSALGLIADYELNYQLDLKFLLNFQFGAEDLSYQTLPDCRYLAGSKYYLFRDQFRAGAQKKSRKNSLEKVALFFGGYDEHNLTYQSLKSLHQISGLDIKVILGPSYPAKYLSELNKFIQKDFIYRDIKDMSSFLRSQDLIICTPSSIACEAAMVGTPSLTVLASENQRLTALGLEKEGASIFLGDWDKFTEKSLQESLVELKSNPDKAKQMSLAGSILFDGLGASRVADEIESILKATSGR